MKYLILLLVILSTSCSQSYEQADLPELIIQVDPTSANSVSFAELVDTAYAVPLSFPDTAYVGLIEHLEVLQDGHYLLMDPYVAESLILMNPDGTFVSWLQRKGQGPGEYSNLFTFSASPDGSKVAIFDRVQLSFHVYSLPDFDHLESYRYPNYIMHMHWIDEETMYIMNEDVDENGQTLGLELFDWSNKKLKKSFLQNNLINSIEMAYPFTFSKAGNKNYFAYQRPLSTIYELGQKTIDPIIGVDFGKATPELGFFKDSEVADFETYLYENFKATFVKDYCIKNDQLSFQYLYREINNNHLAFADLSTLETKVYQNPSWDALNEGQMPTPVARHGDYFVYSISFQDLTPDFFNQQDILSQSLRRAANISGFDPEQLYLLFVKYKNPFEAGL